MLTILTWFKKIRNRKPIVTRKDLRKSFLYSSVYLFIIFCLHTLAMTKLEGLSIGNSIWVTWTTITTVGYGDIPIKSPLGRTSTILLLYLGGIFVLAKTAGDYFDYRVIKHRKQLTGEWRWSMNHHIVIISDHDDHISNQYYERLVTEFQQVPKYGHCAIEILTNNFRDGLPESLQLLGVVHYQGNGNVPKDLEAVNVKGADIIIVLAKRHNDPLSDGNTFDILHRLREYNQTASILVECVDDTNRNRLRQAGANITVRPIRAYPEMMVSAIRAPGSENVIENMFTHQGDKYQRFDIALKKREWAEIVYQLMKADIGTAVAYISDDNEVHCNPQGKNIIDAKALIAMVKEDATPTNEQVGMILRQT